MAERLVALLVPLKEAWSARRDARIRFLKLQVEILRSRAAGQASDLPRVAHGQPPRIDSTLP